MPRRVVGMVCLAVMHGLAIAQVPTPLSASVYPIDLPTTLQLAGAQNLDVRLARTAVEEARANYVIALERFLPAVTPSASYLRHAGRVQAVDGTILDVTKRSEASGVGLSAQIPVGEAIFAALQSRQLLTAADAAATSRELDSTVLAAQQYFELVRARALVDVLEEGLRVSQNYHQQLQEAVRIGIIFKGDALRVETQARRLELDLARTKQQQRLAAARLVQTLHLDPLVEIVPIDTEPVPLALSDLSATPHALLQSALDNRPELAHSEATIAAANQQRRGVLLGPWLPTISLQTFKGDLHGGPGVVDMDAGGTRDRAVLLNRRIGPGGLFDWGRIRASNAKLLMAQLSDEKLRDEISRQVIESYARVQSLFEQVRLAKSSTKSAAETLRMTRERKELGVGTVLEDIQAQQELIRARSDHVASVTELNQEQYALLRAIGSAARRE
jgi:outer membrane protein TolC